MTSSSSHYVIFHGTGGNPGINWLPWLAGNLQSEGHAVSVPRFPTPEGQSLENWREAFFRQVAPLQEDMVLIGHSLGVGMILRLLERSTTPVRGCVFVSGWTGLLNNPDFDPLIASFFQDSFDWPRIKANSGRVQLFHGDNDPYVPVEMAEELSNQLSAPLAVISGGGHLNAQAGFAEFPQLLAASLEFAQ